MKNIKVGLLPLYIKLYDDANVNKDGLVEFYNKVANELEKYGITIIKSPVCRIDSEFKESVKNFEEQGADAIITLHLAYSPSLECIDALANTKLPIIVLDTTEAYSLSKEYSLQPIMFNHGIHGVMDMCNLLKRRGKKYAVCAGHLNDNKVIKKAVDCVKTAVSATSLKGSKTGIFGTSFKGMGDFLVTDKEMQDRFNVTQIHFKDSEMEDAYNSITDEEAIKEIKSYYSEMAVKNPINEENLLISAKSSLALRKLIKERNLDAFTVNFLDIDKKNLKTMPFIECSKQMQNGIGYAGEGDSLTASFVGAIAKCFDEFSFVEIFCPDWKENRILISHMGEMNYAVKQGDITLEESGFAFTSAGFCFKGLAEFKSGSAVFCNVFKDVGDEFKMLISGVEMVSVSTNEFDDSIRGFFKPNCNIDEFLEKLSEHGVTHHSFLVYNVDIKALEFFGNLLDMKVITV